MAMELDSNILNDKSSLFWNNISDILSSSIPNTLPILIAFSWKSARRILCLAFTFFLSLNTPAIVLKIAPNMNGKSF